MDILNEHDLLQVAGQPGTRISIFLPTHRSGPQTERNRIRLKNQLKHAHHALRADGMPTAQIETLLEPGHRIPNLVGLWDQPSDGLAVFLRPDGPRHLGVPLRLPELVTVGDRFVVRPLLSLLSTGGHFYVLALSRARHRLAGLPGAQRRGTRSRRHAHAGGAHEHGRQVHRRGRPDDGVDCSLDAVGCSGSGGAPPLGPSRPAAHPRLRPTAIAPAPRLHCRRARESPAPAHIRDPARPAADAMSPLADAESVGQRTERGPHDPATRRLGPARTERRPPVSSEQPTPAFASGVSGALSGTTPAL